MASYRDVLRLAVAEQATIMRRRLARRRQGSPRH